MIKIIPKKKCKKAKWLSEEALQIAEEREAKGKGEKERYTHLNAEFQRRGRSLNMCVTDYKHCLPWVLLLKIFAFPYVILVQYFAAILVGIRCDILLGDTL